MPTIGTRLRNRRAGSGSFLTGGGDGPPPGGPPVVTPPIVVPPVVIPPPTIFKFDASIFTFDSGVYTFDIGGAFPRSRSVFDTTFTTWDTDAYNFSLGAGNTFGFDASSLRMDSVSATFDKG